MNPQLILGGLKSYLPVPQADYKGTGGTGNGAYCYAVWLRHLSLVASSLGIKSFKPRMVVELGPGDSIGVGLAALLSVADAYIGLDVIEHSSTATNLRVLHELVDLFKRRAPLPDDTTFPRMYPRLPSYDYPAHLLDGAELDARVSETNIALLVRAIEHLNERRGPLQYLSSWSAESVSSGSADLVFSQGALQDMDHTTRRDHLRENIFSMTQWLKPKGVMSHHIELSCPGGKEWNHHWAYRPITWQMIRGNRPYYKNRVPLSEYKKLFQEAGCKIIRIVPLLREGLPREAVATQFRHLPEEDFRTAAALIIAVKR